MKKTDWDNIQTVLLDMDGTLLDLHFDNYFWLQHLPQTYAKKHHMDLAEAERILFAKYKAIEGTMNWYCVDYWSEQLDMDIALLKQQVAHLIRLHPHVPEFLNWLRQNRKKSILVTNAHPKSIDIKFRHTALDKHLDRVISAHDLGMPKEAPQFWFKLHQYIDYHPQTTLLIDDNIDVLKSARQHPIRYLLQISEPDSKQNSSQKAADTTPANAAIPAIRNFSELLQNQASGGS